MTPGRQHHRFSAFAAIALVAGLLSGCTNNALQTLGNIVRTGVSTSNPFAGSGSGEFTVLTLSRVVKSQSNAATFFDLIGNGNGEMGIYCSSVAGAGGSSSSQAGASNCTCNYEYIRNDGGAERFESQTTYVEQDLIRCSYAGIPNDVSYVKVKVRLVNSDSFSNEVTFRFNGAGVTLNPIDPASFVQARRYQCRDAVYIPYLYDPQNMYDPILSEAPDISYPLNFYATNMGGAFVRYQTNQAAQASGNGTGWMCPGIPNDTSRGLDLTVYSQLPDSAGSRQIFPPTGAFDRSTFFIARQSTGVFTVPLNVYLAPSTPTGDAANPPIGFGAAPSRLNDDQEACPDASIPIPAGFQWVKVWAFRASLPVRRLNAPTGIPSSGGIACNTPVFPSSTTPVFPDCGTTGGQASGSGDDIFADRIVWGSTARCFRVNSINVGTDFCIEGTKTNGFGCTTYAQSTNGTQGSQKPGFEVFAAGTDTWIPVGGDTTVGCGGASASTDYLGLCTSYSPGVVVPSAVGDSTLQLDQNNSSRGDFLLVTTPTSTMSRHFLLQESAAGPYIPFRFFSSRYCQSPDPMNPLILPDGSRDCPIDKRILYEFFDIEMTTQDAGSVTDPARSRVFPLCALQPI